MVGPGGFSLQVLALREGERVTVASSSGSPQSTGPVVWKGDRAQLEARQAGVRDAARGRARAMLVVALLAAALGGFLVVQALQRRG